jgi:hypothetical protein
MGQAAAAAVLLLGMQAASAQVLAQRGQAQCSLAGNDERTLLLDSAAQWQAAAGAAREREILRRDVRWARQQVLLHALAEQPHVGVEVSALRLEAAPRGAAQQGRRLLLHVSRPAPGAMVAMALTRPCVWVLLPRSSAPQLRLRLLDGSAQPHDLTVSLEP